MASVRTQVLGSSAGLTGRTAKVITVLYAAAELRHLKLLGRSRTLPSGILELYSNMTQGVLTSHTLRCILALWRSQLWPRGNDSISEGRIQRKLGTIDRFGRTNISHSGSKDAYPM